MMYRPAGRRFKAVALSLALLALLSYAAHAQRPILPADGVPLVDRPWSNDSDKFSFAVIGDKTSGGEGKWPIYDRAVDAINLLRPDFAITVGDQIPGHMQDREQWDAEWAEYMEHARRLEVPLFLVPGNHDIANLECHAFWKEDFGPTYYAFDYRGCHFLVLNTEEERVDGRGPVWESMMQFMEEDLAASRKARHTFVFFHKPMWDDPRYDAAWARLENALAGRRYTVVAGHEHYLATERRDGNLLVIQSATGGGIHLSDVKEFGCFHSFGFVTVDRNDVEYAVVEPHGGVWPVEIAPASFRKSVGFEVAQLDSAHVEGMGQETVTVHTRLALRNPFQEPAAVEAFIGPLDECGWKPVKDEGAGWRFEGGSAVVHRQLTPGGEADISLAFIVPAARLSYPPELGYRVRYKDAWLRKESLHMVEFDVVPIYPRDCFRMVPEWHLVGPFSLGDIDTSHLPGDPAAANPSFFKRFGPEDGFDADRVYDGGLKWFKCDGQRNGLLNFNALMGTLDHAVGYALCGVHSPVRQTVHAALYADNFSQVILNGQLVPEGQDFGAPGGFVYVPLRLEPGWNTVTAKLINNHGDWFLRFLIADPQGNLRIADRPGP